VRRGGLRGGLSFGLLAGPERVCPAGPRVILRLRRVLSAEVGRPQKETRLHRPAPAQPPPSLDDAFHEVTLELADGIEVGKRPSRNSSKAATSSPGKST
jgi:hypothetical protein